MPKNRRRQSLRLIRRASTANIFRLLLLHSDEIDLAGVFCFELFGIPRDVQAREGNVLFSL